VVLQGGRGEREELPSASVLISVRRTWRLSGSVPGLGLHNQVVNLNPFVDPVGDRSRPAPGARRAGPGRASLGEDVGSAASLALHPNPRLAASADPIGPRRPSGSERVGHVVAEIVYPCAV